MYMYVPLCVHMSMCISVCTWVCMHMYTCVSLLCVCINVYLFVCMDVYLYVYTCVSVYLSMSVMDECNGIHHSQDIIVR